MEQFLKRRRLMTAAAWDLDGGVVLVAAGDEIPVPAAAIRLIRSGRTRSTCT